MLHTSSKPKPLTLSLLGMALVIFLWMAWVAIRRGALAGCGEGHSNVLGRHWAYRGPIPEPLIGAVIYLAILMVLLRGKAVPARIFSAIIIAAALFFLVIQPFVLRSFCPRAPNGNWLAYGELSITPSAFPQPASRALDLARTCGHCRPSQLAPGDEGELSVASKSNRFAPEAGQPSYLISAKNIAFGQVTTGNAAPIEIPFTRNLAPSGTTPTGSDFAGLHLV